MVKSFLEWEKCMCPKHGVCDYMLSHSLSDFMNCSPPDSSVHGILQARILEWVAISSSRGSSHPGIVCTFPALAGGFFITETPGKPLSRVNRNKPISRHIRVKLQKFKKEEGKQLKTNVRKNKLRNK